MLGGLMISLDFMGTDNLDKIEKSLQKHLTNYEYGLGEFLLGGSMMIIGIISNALWALLYVTILVFLYILGTYFNVFFVLAIVISYFLVAAATIIVHRRERNNYNTKWDKVVLIILFPILGVWFTFCLVLYMVIYAFTVILLGPVFAVNHLREKHNIPYIVKLIGVFFVASAFIVFACSHMCSSNGN